MLSLLRASATPAARRSRSSFASFSFSFSYSTSTSPTGTESPTYPGLYYHRHPRLAPTAFLVSYLPNPPPSLEFSPTTIGTVSSPRTAATEQPGRLPPISPRTLTENPDFLRLVHEVIALNLADDPWFETLAKSTPSDTHIHIGDQRQPSDANRIPDPQDIVGSVLVQNQRVVPESYEPNHVAYRLVTEAGLMQLPGHLHSRLREACERVFELEKEAAADAAAAADQS